MPKILRAVKTTTEGETVPPAVTETAAPVETLPSAEAAAPAKIGRWLATDTIAVLVDNPKKTGTKAHPLFALYGSKGSTTTVGDYAKAVGAAYCKAALAWDSKRKFIAVTRDGSPVA